MKWLGFWAVTLIAATLLLTGELGCRETVVTGGVAVSSGYDYYYYPNSEVYFYPTGHVYYWRDHDGWQHGHDVPGNFHVEREQGVSLHLNTQRPYEMHDSIRTAHPGVHEEEHH